MEANGTKARSMMISLPMLNQSEVDCEAHIKAMSCAEMEQRLMKQSRRPPPASTGDEIQGAPQTARTLLEENKQLVLEKQHRKALERKNSREFVERLLADDRVVNEADKAKDIGRRVAQRGLAQYYKSKIAEKEVEKSNAYQSKLSMGVDIQHFPFVEGETISQNRRAEAVKMATEMRGFLQKQREEKPPRVDAMMLDADAEYQHRYPLMPACSVSARGPRQPMEDALSELVRSGEQGRPASASGASRSREGSTATGEAAPHLARYPKFLCRAREHMSRRVQDTHVRKALEDKVERTKADLEELTRKRHSEAQEWDDGMMVNDALRYDGTRLKAAERQNNATYIQKQVEEKKQKQRQELEAKRAEPAGYWGPDDKQMQDSDELRHLASGLIKQMEVNQNRKIDSRSKRLQQEQVVIDNSLAEMSADRVKEREKLVQHKAILTTTWESQRKIRQVMNRIDKL